MPDSLLEEAFRRARRELPFFPSIAQIRDFAGCHNGDEIDADAAWVFVCDYIRDHGIRGSNVYVFDLPVRDLFGRTCDERVRGTKATVEEEINKRKKLLEMHWIKTHDRSNAGFTCPEITYREIKAPWIPVPVEYALQQLASGSVTSGLQRIDEAMKLADNKEVSFVRKEFVAAYLRGVAVERRHGERLVLEQ